MIMILIKMIFLKKMNSKIKNYDNFINKYHCFEKGKEGSQQIIDIIKDKFF